MDRKHSIIGGSTLATQLEKMRHSPGGRTGSVKEKARQVAAASLRSYLDGVDTRETQRRIIRDYLNSMPLAATPAQGEVIGLGDGLNAWYGADFSRPISFCLPRKRTWTGARVSNGRVLTARFFRCASHSARRAGTWSNILTGFAFRRTAIFARWRRARSFPLACEIWPWRRIRNRAPIRSKRETANFVSNKAPDAIRSALLGLLGLDNAYALDRLDLTVKTTLDRGAQNSVTGFLQSLSEPSKVAAANLNQYQLLDGRNPEKVIYSVTLYEQTGGVNQLRSTDRQLRSAARH